MDIPTLFAFHQMPESWLKIDAAYGMEIRIGILIARVLSDHAYLD